MIDLHNYQIMEPKTPKNETEKEQSQRDDKELDKSLLMLSHSIKSLNDKSFFSEFQLRGTFTTSYNRQSQLKLKTNESVYSQGANLSVNSNKRVNAVQIHPTLIKKIKKNTPEEQPPIQTGSIEEQVGNHKITDFFGTKTSEKQKKAQSSKDQQQKNPIVKSLKEKIAKKQACIEQTLKAIENIKQKQANIDKEFDEYKKERLKKIVQVLQATYSAKIFKSGFNKFTFQENSKQIEQKIRQLDERCRNLKDVKQRKKNKGKKDARDHLSDQQSNILMEAYDKDRINYLGSWINRLQKQKQRCLSDHSRHHLRQQTEYYPLPQIVKTQLCKQGTMSRVYVPLAGLQRSLYNYQVLSMNTETLNYQLLFLVKQPTIFAQERRILLQNIIQDYHAKASVISSHPVFLQPIQSSYLNRSYMLFSRCYCQNSTKLSQLIQKYQQFPQNIAKYIAKCCLQTVAQVKNKIGIDFVLTTNSIQINDKFDVKVDGNAAWILPIFSQFRQQHDRQSLSYYSSELLQNDNGKFAKNMSVWSIGIILFQLIYGKKPFQYVLDQQFRAEDFYLKNQFTDANFPVKSGVTPNCKQFIKCCLQKQNQRLTVSGALRHSYLYR